MKTLKSSWRRRLGFVLTAFGVWSPGCGGSSQLNGLDPPQRTRPAPDGNEMPVLGDLLVAVDLAARRGQVDLAANEAWFAESSRSHAILWLRPRDPKSGADRSRRNYIILRVPKGRPENLSIVSDVADLRVSSGKACSRRAFFALAAFVDAKGNGDDWALPLDPHDLRVTPPDGITIGARPADDRARRLWICSRDGRFRLEVLGMLGDGWRIDDDKHRNQP